jgi:hypothetical protein
MSEETKAKLSLSQKGKKKNVSYLSRRKNARSWI